ncbi:MAG: SOS response-associated peptidase [Jatrophihabitans sp.]
MCGRYVSVRSDDDLTNEFDVDEVVGEQLAPSWNVAPTDSVRIIAKRRPHGSTDPTAEPLIQLRTASWGLIPGWTRRPAGSNGSLATSRPRKSSAKMINARSETVASKPAFKTAAARRRCLTPSLGYFEWQKDNGRKIPYFLHDPADRTLAMAGLYEIWRDDALSEDDPQRWVWTCSIITRPATDLLGEIHDRCPVLVPQGLQQKWLDCSDDDPGVAQRLLDEMPEPHLDIRLVSTAVGNVKNNGPELIEPLDSDAVEGQQLLDF